MFTWDNNDIITLGLDKIRASSSEYPTTTLAQPAPWLYDALGLGITDAGVRVSERSSLQASAVYACVRVISESVASLPLHVYRSDDGGVTQEKATDRREYYLLHDQPNEIMSSFTLFELGMVFDLLWGNSYNRLEFDGAGRLIALWPLPADQTWPEIVNKKLVYRTNYYSPQGNGEIIPHDEVLHVPGLGFNGIVGMSVISYARQAIGLGLAAEKFGAKLFSNGLNAGGVLEHPGLIGADAIANLQASMERRNGGLDNAHRLMILEEGMKYNKLTINPDDAQFLETRKFQVSEIARMFRVPPHLIGDLEKATFSNIEHQSLEFVVYTLRPWLVRWEQEINRKLFAKTNFFARFNVEGLLRGDMKSRYDSYAVGRQWGFLSPNDVCKLENMNPISPEKGGDDYWRPVNTVPTDAPVNQSGQSGAAQGLAAPAPMSRLDNDAQDASQLVLFRDAVGRTIHLDDRDVVRRKAAVVGIWTPILTALAQGMTDCELNIKTRRFIVDYAGGIATRSREWKVEQVDGMAETEGARARNALLVAISFER